jgi:predicted phage terminase large subunit-like protein
VLKQECERDHLMFTRVFFKHRQGMKFRVNWHHVLLAEEIERVISGETQNLVVNVPPGSSKTEMVVINLIARGLAKNPRARFLHIAGGDDLALLNSQTAKEMVQSDEFQASWALPVADDAKAKKRWNVVVDGKKAGGVYAVSLGGQITGFRAGHMDDGWQGAIIIDDPLKPEDAYSKPKRTAANRRLLSTVKSRKANPRTPIIVIMQRLAEQDVSGFIAAGNLPGEWRHVVIPALIDDAYVANLPEHIREMVDSGERDEKGRFSYWPYKEPLADLLAMEKGAGADQDGAKVSRYVFNAQYQQRPTALGGDIIKTDGFGRWKALPRLKVRKIYVDTAQKTKERNDFSVFLLAGLGDDGKLYLLDLLRGKWEAPKLRRNAFDFWAKHKTYDHKVGAPLRKMMIEDKASGTGLIQDIASGEAGKGRIPVEGVQRSIDKLTRVMDVVSYIDSGYVLLPEEADWVSAFLAECEAFTADDTHEHDDQVDALADAINDLLANASSNWGDWV